MTALLSVDGITKRFRGLLAVDSVTFEVADGEIFAVIGPNGAGKTTLFNMIAGVLPPNAGSITFAGERIEGLTSDKICRRGIGRTFQIVRPFPALTVEDNVIVGALLHRHDVDDAREHARDVLRRLDLYVKRNQAASSLTLPMEVDVVVATLRELNRQTGLTILLIEHVMRAVMALAARVLVLHHGAAIAEGAPDAVVRNPAVIDSYLGAEAVG
jgi:branched-chain amino acid transport system ATP-binding protein